MSPSKCQTLFSHVSLASTILCYLDVTVQQDGTALSASLILMIAKVSTATMEPVWMV